MARLMTAPCSWRGVRRTPTVESANLRPDTILAPLRLLSAVSLWVRTTLALPGPPPTRRSSEERPENDR